MIRLMAPLYLLLPSLSVRRRVATCSVTRRVARITKMADKENKPLKNEKKPLNRQNSSWYNMSFLDCGYCSICHVDTEFRSSLSLFFILFWLHLDSYFVAYD